MMTSSRGAVACKYKTAPIRSECEYCCWRADCLWDEIERLRAKAAQQKVAYDAYVCMEAKVERLQGVVDKLSKTSNERLSAMRALWLACQFVYVPTDDPVALDDFRAALGRVRLLAFPMATCVKEASDD